MTVGMTVSNDMVMLYSDPVSDDVSRAIADSCHRHGITTHFRHALFGGPSRA